MRRKLALKKSESDSDFLNHSTLGAEVEAVFGAGGLTYLEACVEVAEYRGIEVEVLAKNLPKQIRDKLLAEASERRLLKPEHRISTLPL